MRLKAMHETTVPSYPSPRCPPIRGFTPPPLPPPPPPERGLRSAELSVHSDGVVEKEIM